MIRQWKEFEIGAAGAVTDLHVTLSQKGEILLGAAAVSRFGSPDAAILLFDEVNNSIGLLPSNLRNKNAYPLKRKGQNQYRIIRAARFCRHHNIRVDRRIKFNTPELDPEGILILDLKKSPPSVVSQNRQDRDQVANVNVRSPKPLPELLCAEGADAV